VEGKEVKERRRKIMIDISAGNKVGIIGNEDRKDTR
jgi:hypothetical protein